MQYLYLFLALLAGSVMPVQGAINHKLSTYVGSPVMSAFISFLIGTVALLFYMLASGISLSSLLQMKTAPPLTWTGGLLGAFFVTVIIITVPRLGVALTFSLVILGQMISTLPIDHVGFMGLAVKQINWQRIAGVVMIIIGVILIRRF